MSYRQHDGLHTAVVSVAPAWSSSTPRPLRLALIQLGVTALLLGTILIVLVAAASPYLLWAFVLNVLVAWVYLAAGITAWWRRPSNRIGAVMVLGAGSWFLADLVNTPDPCWSRSARWSPRCRWPWPCTCCTRSRTAACPVGRPGSPSSPAICRVLQAPQYLFRADAEPYHLLWIADRPELAALGRNLQSLAGSAVMIATGVLLAMRLRRATPDRRRILVLFFGYGILVVLIVPLSPNVIGPLLDLSVEATVALQLLVLAGLPAVFAVGVLRGTFARTGEIQELGAVLGATGVTRPDLDQALARTLGDRVCPSRSG